MSLKNKIVLRATVQDNIEDAGSVIYGYLFAVTDTIFCYLPGQAFPLSIFSNLRLVFSTDYDRIFPNP
jgi:hypothetical protein